MDCLIKFENVTKKYKNKINNNSIFALKNISFELKKNITHAIIGDSGAGKTTIGSLILGLLKPDSGKIYYENTDILQMDKKQLKGYQRKISVLFQEPYLSFNPFKLLIKSLEEPLLINTNLSQTERINVLLSYLDQLKIDEKDIFSKLPSQVSGGELQRIALIRAILLKPDFLILDEPFASIDKENRQLFIDFLLKLKKEGMNLLYISHDINVVLNNSQQVMVLNQGEIVENCETNALKFSKNDFVKCLLNFKKI